MSKIVADNLNARVSNVTIVGVTTASSNGLNVTGVVTATSFEGDGSNLTNAGISAANSVILGWILN
jgi:hypothetical protein